MDKFIGVNFRIEFHGEDDTRTLYNNSIFIDNVVELENIPKKLDEISLRLHEWVWKKQLLGQRHNHEQLIVTPIFE